MNLLTFVKKTGAMTLIELILTMAVMGILMTLSFGGIERGQGNAYFKEAVETTIDLIQGARSRALSSMTLEIAGVEYTAQSFYLELSGNTLSLYADLEGADDQLLYQKIINPNLIVSTEPTDLSKIIYHAPLGEVEFVSTTEPDALSAQIQISTADGVSKRLITLTEMGRIPEVISGN